MSRPLRPYAQFDHGPEHPDECVRRAVRDDMDAYHEKRDAETPEQRAFREYMAAPILPTPAQYMERRFGYDYRYWLIENLTEEQIAMIGLYIHRGDTAEAGRYLGELCGEAIKMLIRNNSK